MSSKAKTENISEELKLKGNKCFAQGKFKESIDFYSKAIQENPSNAVLFSNRAIANIKLKRFLEAEKDCSLALEHDSSFDKAFYRRGLARKELKLYKSAMSDFSSALKITPNNSEIQKELNELKKLVNSASKIKIHPIKKPNEFKSTSQLKQIPIENCDVLQSQQTDSIDTILANQIVKLVTDRTPTNYSQFENDWRQLALCPMNHKVEYLETISLSILEEIFKFPFDSKLLFEILEALSNSKKNLFVFQVLQFMTKIPRFETIIFFFSDNEFKVLNEIFSDILKSNQVNRELLLSLAEAFNVKQIK